MGKGMEGGVFLPVPNQIPVAVSTACAVVSSGAVVTLAPEIE